MKHSLNPEISVECGPIELFCNNASLALPYLLDLLGLLGHEKSGRDDAYCRLTKTISTAQVQPLKESK